MPSRPKTVTTVIFIVIVIVTVTVIFHPIAETPPLGRSVWILACWVMPFSIGIAGRPYNSVSTTVLHCDSLRPSDGGPRPLRCVGGGRRGVINNFGDSCTLMITVTVQLTPRRLVVWKSVDDTHVYLCRPLYDTQHRMLALRQLSLLERCRCVYKTMPVAE